MPMMRGDAAPPSHSAAKLRSALHRSRSQSQRAEARPQRGRGSSSACTALSRSRRSPRRATFRGSRSRPTLDRVDAARLADWRVQVDAVDRSPPRRGRPRSAGGGGASFGREDRHQHLGRTVRPRGQYHALPLDFDPGLKPRPDVSAIRKRMHRDVAAFRPPVVYDARYGKSKAEAAPDRRRAREQQMRALNHPPGPGPAAYDHQLWRPWSAASYKSGTNWSWHDRPEVGEAQQRELGHTNFNAGSRGGLTTAERAAASSRPSSATLRALSPPLTPPGPFADAAVAAAAGGAAADVAAAVGAALRKAVELGHAPRRASSRPPPRRRRRRRVGHRRRGGATLVVGRAAAAGPRRRRRRAPPTPSTRARGGWLHGPSGRASAVVGDPIRGPPPGPAAHDPRPVGGDAAHSDAPELCDATARAPDLRGAQPRLDARRPRLRARSTPVRRPRRRRRLPSRGRSLEVRNLRRRARRRMLYASELALLRRYVETKREEPARRANGDRLDLSFGAVPL